MVLSCETSSTYIQYFFIAAGVNACKSYISGAYYSHWSFNMHNKNRWATLHKMALIPHLVGLLFHNHCLDTNYSRSRSVSKDLHKFFSARQQCLLQLSAIWWENVVPFSIACPQVAHSIGECFSSAFAQLYRAVGRIACCVSIATS